ncbi:MAG: alpha/beta hydrolase [Gemmatimonadota bacterium]|nr:alpha/beta hydrolase [Gemmatimonadota bacterium]
MRNRTRLATRLIVVATILAGAAFYYARNPEREALDDAARAGAPGKFVHLADGVTHYEMTGAADARTVVLIHGFSVPYYIWDSTAAALATHGFRVVRLDLFGRGWSDRPDVEYDASLFDRQVTGLLDSLRIAGPVDVMGLSMGGMVAANFAARHPERTRTLTLIDPAAAHSSTPLMIRVPLVGTYIFQTMAVPTMADGQFGDFAEPKRFPDWADKYRPQMRYRGFGRALRSTGINSARVDPDSLYSSVGKLTMPVLLIWGKLDTTVPFDLSANVRRDIPRAEFHPIEHAAHLPNVERASEVNPIILAFLQRQGA